MRSIHSQGHDDHHLQARRSFLRQLGLLTAGTALLPHTGLRALGSSALAQALLDSPGDRILVLIRLKGGNDGLNMVVPLYDFARYRNARPRLAHARNSVLDLTPELGFAPTMAAAAEQWQRGALRIVNGVGYPNPSLSHFRSTDILTSASAANEVLSSGWLGRHLDACFPDYLLNPPAAPPAIQIGGAGSLTFTNEENVSLAVTVNSVEELAEIAQRGELYDTIDLPDCLYGEQLGYLRGVANSAFTFAPIIEAAYNRGQNQVVYGAGSLYTQLAVVARLIKGGLGTRLYLVTLDGFDTHASQTNQHGSLLAELGAATSSFFADLTLGQQAHRVLATTFSEFGRRIEENSSAGTDHGTAAPQLLFGPGLQGNGAHGALPDLDDPDNEGNLRFSTDFRSVYATLLEHWLCLPAASVDGVLGGSFPRLDLGFDCQSVGLADRGPAKASALTAKLQLQSNSHWNLEVEVSNAGEYKFELLDLQGRVLFAEKRVLPQGHSNWELFTSGSRTPTGMYAYRLQGRGAIASGMIPMIR